MGATQEREKPGGMGADKAYDTADFVATLRAEGITPHVAEHITAHRGSNLDGRTTRHPGYALSQRARKRIEEIFGWGKTIGGWRKSRYRGLATQRLLGVPRRRRPTTWSG